MRENQISNFPCESNESSPLQHPESIAVKEEGQIGDDSAKKERGRKAEMEGERERGSEREHDRREGVENKERYGFRVTTM